MDEDMGESMDTADVDVDIPDDVPEDIPEDIPDDVPDDIPEDLPEEDLPEDIPEDVPDDVPDDIPEDIPEDESADDFTDDFSEDDVPDDIPEDNASDDADDLNDAASDDIPDDIPEDLPEDLNGDDAKDTDDVPEEISEDVDAFDDLSAAPVDDTADNQGEAPVDDTADDQGEAPVDDTADDQGEASADDAAVDQGEVPVVDGEDDHKNGITDAHDVGRNDTQDSSAQNAFSSLSEYMNAHNYGPDDFATYSQDPEWRALQREAFPDYELPPLSQESAYSQLSDYMNAHNYGPDDFATYSQDPTWRELQSAAFPDYKLPSLVDSEALSNGKVPDDVFTGTTDLWDVSNNTKLEDLSKADFDQLQAINPERASQMLTDYNDRHIPHDDLSKLPNALPFDNAPGMEVIDSELSPDKATIQDTITGQEYTAYPNPMGRASHMAGQQGQNDVGMQQDCGIASTAKGINDLYGKNVTTENRLADFAKQTGNCDLSEAVTYSDGTVDYSDCGGTVEDNVREFYNANGIDATAYTGNDVPAVEALADSLKDGGVATVAVNHDLMWNFDEAQAFDPSMIDQARYASDSAYASRVDTYMDMHDGVGTYRADHFVNVSNAVYDSNGALSHFIVSDTGNGTTKMIPKDYFQRAYNGLGNIRVSAQGCVIAERRK